MARTSRRSKNRLMKEIDQGIQEYETDARERACRRRHGRLLDILTSECRTEGIFHRPMRPEAPVSGGFLGSRTISRPVLWC